MSVVPEKRSEKIGWCQARVAPWTTNAVAIGTSEAEVTAWEARLDAAQAALTAATDARAASKAATETLNNTIAALDVATQGIIKQVRAKAETTHNPEVYTLALVPAPATPAPVGAPGTPSNFAVELKANGSLDLSWKCNNPVGCTGVVYQVWRRVGSAPGSEFTYVGGSGERKFLDATIPAGATQLTYQIQAVRSTAVGPWSQFNVNFGTQSSGVMTATVTEASPRMAA